MRIYSQDIKMEFGIEKCAMFVMNSGKRNVTEGVELPNQEKLGTLGEKENYEYFGILEADTIKQGYMKEKIEKSISKEPENNSRQNYIAGTLSKG